MTRGIIGTPAAAVLIAALGAGCAATDDRAQGPPDRDRRSGFSGYDCSQVARQVEDASRGDYLEVGQVNALAVVEDHRQTYALPPGDERALVLRCSGSGQWSWGRGPVMLEVSIDRHGETWINWEPTY